MNEQDEWTAPDWISPFADRSDLVMVEIGTDNAFAVVERCSPNDWRLGFRKIDEHYRTLGFGYRSPPVVVVEVERLLSEAEVEEARSKAWDVFKALDGEQ